MNLQFYSVNWTQQMTEPLYPAPKNVDPKALYLSRKALLSSANINLLFLRCYS
jgi:hypothetical protein